MSGYDYSHTDYVRGRPIISYDVGRGTRTYVTRIESHASTGYKYPTSHAKVDSSMLNHDRPPEVENFITQILNEVNVPPGLATIPNPRPRPTWGRHSSPVKGYPTIDYGTNYYPSSQPVKSKILWDHGDPYDHKDRSPGLVYDQPPQRDSSIPNKGYSDQSHTKPKAPRDYGAPREWDRYPADDPWSQYKSPNNWGNSYSSEDHEVPDKRWDKSSPSYDERSPYNQPSKTWRDYSLGNNRWGISGGKPQSSDSYEIPRNSWDKPSSYDQPPLDGNAPKNSQKPQSLHSYGPYGIHDNQHRRSSSPIHDYPSPDGNNTGGVPNSRWGSSLVKSQSPKGHGVSSNQWYRSSSPVKDHSPPFSNNKGGVHDVPSNRWGNSSMKPQSPTGQGSSNNRWDRSLSPVHDHSPARTNTGRLPSIPSSRWGNSLTKPLSPKGHENPGNHYRSLSPNHDTPPPTKKTGGDPDDVPSSRWGNSLMKPQYPEVHRAPNNQWDRSSRPNYDRQPTKKTEGEPGVQSNGWDNSMMKPRSPEGYGASNNQWGKTPSPDRCHPLQATKNTDGVHSAPRNRWDNLMNPQSPKDHGVPIKQWNRSSSPVHDHPPPRNNGRVSDVPSNQWGNSLEQPQSIKDYDVPNNQLGKTSNRALHHPPPSKNNGGALGMPSKERSDSMKPQPSYDRPSPTEKYGSTTVKPQPFKNHEAPRSMSPKNDHPKPSGNTGRVLDNQWPNSSVKSQPAKEYGARNSKLDRQSSLARDHSPLNGNTGGPPVKPPQSPKGGYNQWNRPSSSPTRNPIGVPSSKLGNSSVNPQSPRAISSPYDKPIGNNNDTQISKTKPDGYTYDQQPKDYESKTGTKPSSYHSSPPRLTTTPPGKVTNTNIEPSPNLKIETGRSPDYLTNSQSRNNSGYSYPASKEPIREAKSNIR